MKKLIFFFIAFATLAAQAQFYQFAKTTGTYTPLSGETVILNTNWKDTLVSLKTPFFIKFFNTNVAAGPGDSIQLSDFGNVYFNNINNGSFEVFGADLNSRGNNKSPISFKLDGTAPSRILKIQFKDAGFSGDAPNFTDSMNFQLWIYETSFILEFRYGPNSVQHSSYLGENGAYVDIGDPMGVSSNFIALEGDPANPTIRRTQHSMQTTLNGTPANGTIYRFTPSPFPTGIQGDHSMKINIIENKLVPPASMEVNLINIYNTNGALLQSFKNIEEVSFANLVHGLYIVTLDTPEGLLIHKLVL